MLSPLNRFDRFIAESEARIEEQKELIIVFGKLGMSTVEAEKRLADFETSLLMYREAVGLLSSMQRAFIDSDTLPAKRKIDEEASARKQER